MKLSSSKQKNSCWPLAYESSSFLYTNLNDDPGKTVRHYFLAWCSLNESGYVRFRFFVYDHYMRGSLLCKPNT